MHIEPFNDRHVEAAGRLLAARHARERVQALPRRFENPDLSAGLVVGVLAAPGASGVVALRRGEVVGFLVGEDVRVPAGNPVAAYFRPESALVRYHTHAAVSGGTDDIYRAMYAAAAENWIAGGATAHYVQLAAGDVAAGDTFSSLGFGRERSWALRDTAAVAGETPPEVTIRRAGPADLETVVQLDAALSRFESGSPVFMPYPTPLAEIETRAELASSLVEPEVRHWLAERDGAALGLLTFVPPPGHVSPLLTPERTAYISGASVVSEARGSGIGAALLRHGLADARERGFEWCRLSYMTANPLSGPFWRRHGFRPIAWHLCRVVDGRVRPLSS